MFCTCSTETEEIKMAKEDANNKNPNCLNHAQCENLNITFALTSDPKKM
jgi:hypothetical protein